MKPNFRQIAPVLAAAFSAWVVFPAAGEAAVVTTLHSFGIFTNGADPYCALARGNDGNFYGTTSSGGSHNVGTVFQVTTNGALTEIYAFTNGVDGSSPQAGLTLGADGRFYGTAEGGGTNDSGTVFAITTAGNFTALYSFGATDANGNNADGAEPVASLVQAANGLLYGTAYQGGPDGEGTVFEISTNGAFSLLYSFTGGNDGGLPAGSLAQGSDGYFYGTTSSGGTNDYGAIFKIESANTFAPLYSFTNGTDGAMPMAGLVLGNDTALYGTAREGGAHPPGYGTIFKITSSGIFAPLYSFANGSDGGNPVAPLIQGSDLNFYGTSTGPTSGFGTLFRMTPGGDLNPLYDFTGKADGAYPQGALMQNTDGTLYGTAAAGGADGAGTIYKVTTNSVFTPLLSFVGGFDGENPAAPVIQSADGDFYGTTFNGGSGSQGVAFQMTPTGNVTTLHAFTNGIDGSTPLALAPSDDGSFYGVTFGGGTEYSGTVFHLTTNGAFAPVHSFNGGSDGGNPDAGLVRGTDGYLYGTTSDGGGGGYGTVFKMTAAGAVTILYNFTNGIDGAVPEAPLVQGKDGNFYGTTSAGGDGYGTVFEVSSNGGASFASLYVFTNGVDGGNPQAGLVQGADLNFYGTTYLGGLASDGVVFKITSAGGLTPLYSFTGGNDGANPAAGLLLSSDGNFYGTTYNGGAYGEGAIFKVASGPTFTALYSFTGGNDGANPAAPLTQGSNGSLYGTTYFGGVAGMGTVFELTGLLPVAPKFVSIKSSSPGVVLTWSATPGQTYQLQFVTNLLSTNWSDVGNPILASGESAGETNLFPFVPPSPRYYRVVSWLPGQ